MNPFIDRRALAPICASLILLLCTFNVSCSSNPCAPVFSAVERLRGTAYHAFGSQEISDGNETIYEVIDTGDDIYVKRNGKWAGPQDSPDHGINDLLQQVKDAASISCRLERAELLDGESADHYVAEGKSGVVDMQGDFWLSKSTSALLRINFKAHRGDSASGVAAIRYEYTNVSAPIISK